MKPYDNRFQNTPSQELVNIALYSAGSSISSKIAEQELMMRAEKFGSFKSLTGALVAMNLI